MSRFTVAAAQYPIDQIQSFNQWEDKLARWVAEAKAGGASLALFPEYGAMELTAIDEKARDDLAYSLGWLADRQDEIDAVHAALATEHDMLICAASMPVRGKNGLFYNEARLFAPRGKMGAQRKIVMTRFEREEWGVSGGSELVLFHTALGKIGITICYDAEFPLLARTLTEAGAAVLLAPSATDSLHGYWRVRLGAQARALENQCLVVQSPTVGEALWCASLDINRGAAGVYGPPDRGVPENGVIAIGEMDAPSWLFAELDQPHIRTLRADGAVLNHRDWHEQMPEGVHAESLPLKVVDLR